MNHSHHQHDPGVEVERPFLHARKEETRALRLALTISFFFMLIEFAGGLWTNSLALLADAGHMLTDVGALGLSLFAVWFASLAATPEKTYGYFRVEILAALVNGVTLVVIALLILYESYQRFLEPAEIKSLPMLAIATAGLVANLICARILHGHDDNLNVRGAFLHVIGDVLGSIGAILAGLAMLLWQAYWVDPVVSVLVSLLIVYSAWKLVADSVRVLLEATPAHVNLSAMKRLFCQVPGVESVHDLHVWTLTSGVHAMTCHAVVGGPNERHQILESLSAVSRERFNIHHTTIQLEEEDLCEGQQRFCH